MIAIIAGRNFQFKAIAWPVALVLLVALVTAASQALRLNIIEPEAIAVACAAHQEGWRCSLREAVVYGFLHNVFGWTSLLVGVLATVSRWRWLGMIAVATGIAGAIFYTYELSGVGLLLGAMVCVQRPPLTDADHNRKQSA